MNPRTILPFLLALGLLSSCGFFDKPESAADAIARVNIGIDAAAGTAADRLGAGMMTADAAVQLSVQLHQARNYTKAAEAALAAGGDTSAPLALAIAALTAVENELAARAPP